MRFGVTNREMVTECIEDEIIHTSVRVRRRERRRQNPEKDKGKLRKRSSENG